MFGTDRTTRDESSAENLCKLSNRQVSDNQKWCEIAIRVVGKLYMATLGLIQRASHNAHAAWELGGISFWKGQRSVCMFLHVVL